MADAFLQLATQLASRRAQPEAEDSASLRLRTAAALDAAIKSGAQLRNDQVDMQSLRPPWLTSRACSSLPGTSVQAARAALVGRHSDAAAILGWLDARADALEPYRRLGEARHLPWASASVAATVAAVQRARGESRNGAEATPPRVLIAQGSLGAEAAAAAAAGGRVVVCEPNRFAAAAIREVAALHGVGHAVSVVERTIEELASSRDLASTHAHVVVLTPLLEEAALGKRLLPSAAAAVAAARSPAQPTKSSQVESSHVTSAAAAPAAAASTGGTIAPGKATTPLLVPARVDTFAALGLLTAGT